MKKIISILAGLSLFAGMVMASNEISLQGYLQALKGTRQIVRSPGTITTDWIGTKIYGPVIYSATPAYQAASAGSIVSNGICWVRNVDTQAVITISFNGGTNDHLQVKANEFFVFRLMPTLPVASLMFKTATAKTNDFEITILEN